MVRRNNEIWMICLLIVAGLTMAISACAQNAAPINKDGSGSAIKGYDTVAYFTKGKPVKGMYEFSFEWKGGMRLF